MHVLEASCNVPLSHVTMVPEEGQLTEWVVLILHSR